MPWSTGSSRRKTEGVRQPAHPDLLAGPDEVRSSTDINAFSFFRARSVHFHPFIVHRGASGLDRAHQSGAGRLPRTAGPPPTRRQGGSPHVMEKEDAEPVPRREAPGEDRSDER